MNRDQEVSAKYYGIGGWLLLFIIALTVLSPIATLRNVSMNVGRIHPAYRIAPVYGLLVVVDSALATIFALGSICCGILLLKKSRSAVVITKRYLITILFYALGDLVAFAVFSPRHLWNPNRYESSLLWVFLRQTGFVLIWYSYLSKSKRVAATYGPLGAPSLKLFSPESTAPQTPV